MPTIITRDQVKAKLGLTGDATYDTEIDAQLPVIDAKVKLITRNNWNKRIYGDTVSGSDYILVSDYGSNGYDYIADWLQLSAQLTGTGIDTGAYIIDIWDEGTADSDNYPQIQISSNATATANSVDLFLGFPTAYHDIVAKGVWYLISGTSTKLPKSSPMSERMGPVSVGYSAADNKIDGRSGMPSWFVKGLPTYHGGL